MRRPHGAQDIDLRTAYSVSGRAELIGGTGYAKKKGRVLVNGTGYDIPFSSGIPLSTVALGDTSC